MILLLRLEQRHSETVMTSVTLRGSGWVNRLPIVDCRFQIDVSAKANRQLTIDNRQ
jgi:hypothetical protein